MKRTTVLVCLALLAACGGASTGDSRSGTGGSGATSGTGGTGGTVEPPPPPPDVDEICRSYCGSQEPNGPTCDNGGNAAYCRDSCLQEYTLRTNPECPEGRHCDESVASRCVEEMMWDRYGCDLDLECNDEFHDCRYTEPELADCEIDFNESTATWCQENCPDDPACGRNPSRLNTWGRNCYISCDSDSRCPSGWYCGDGVCTFDCTSTNPDCALGEACDFSRGRCDAVTCSANADCPGGTYCDGICTYDCRSTPECALGQNCNSRGQCEDIACDSDTECPYGWYCGGVVCTSDCSEASPRCPSDEVCDFSRGYCRVPQGGEYTFTCNLPGLPIPMPVTIQINAEDPGFSVANTSSLTTQLGYTVAPEVVDLLPRLAPDSMFSSVQCAVGVAGGSPAGIQHTAEGLPFAPVSDFNSDTVNTSITPDGAEVALSVTGFSAVISGLPEALVVGGTIDLTAGQGDCGAIEPVQGSGPVRFQVTP